MEILKGGLADNKNLMDVIKKHMKNETIKKKDIDLYKNKLNVGIKVELEHTSNKKKAEEIVLDYLLEDPDYYTKLAKADIDEITGSGSSGEYSVPIFSELNEVTDTDSTGAFDVPFNNGKKDPLQINGEKSIKTSRAVKDKNFPKWGGPGGVFVKIKDKCKKFPYCNQGDTGSIEMFEIKELNESIQRISKKTGVPYANVEKIILKEIKDIFINNENK